ncbi:hypothetical protein [Bryobacter aggregatus]|uniref:hypothetical protein n=1 Tax=Bryobacter aggregatus TaxID=360054 RepID=UPI0004E19B4D|nr:hypothetical protein [Bryobacter aggregatus]
MKNRLLFVLSLLCAISLAQAHFVWVLSEAGGTRAKVILSEDLKTTAEVDVALIQGAKLSVRDAKGVENPLQLTKAGDSYVASLSGHGQRVIHGVVNLGVMQRGNSPEHVLIYYPKAIVGDAFDPSSRLAAAVPVELVPVPATGGLQLQMLALGKPLADAEIQVIEPDGMQRKIRTNAQGLSEVLTQKGRYGAWSRYWETKSGEQDGKQYVQLRHYATLVFDTPQNVAKLPSLPEATSSFGAVVSEGWLYVYGGHISPTHSYSTAAVSGQFHRLQLSQPETWERLEAGPGLQGMNLAAHQGKIYRIGGMEPRNAPGTPSDLYSTADCARFDPAKKRWESLPPLPQPRSSHDVVVIGNQLYVVGGWELQGKAGQKWPQTMEVMDLSAKTLAWKSVKQPFLRRALIAAAHEGKVYVMGGFTDRSSISAEVNIYDPKTGEWSKGPEMPGGKEEAFAPAAVEHGQRLFVSIANGALYRLGKQWEKVAETTPRIAHRMASDGTRIYVMGGAEKGKNLDLIEVVTIP